MEGLISRFYEQRNRNELGQRGH